MIALMGLLYLAFIKCRRVFTPQAPFINTNKSLVFVYFPYFFTKLVAVQPEIIYVSPPAFLFSKIYQGMGNAFAGTRTFHSKPVYK